MKKSSLNLKEIDEMASQDSSMDVSSSTEKKKNFNALGTSKNKDIKINAKNDLVNIEKIMLKKKENSNETGEKQSNTKRKRNSELKKVSLEQRKKEANTSDSIKRSLDKRIKNVIKAFSIDTFEGANREIILFDGLNFTPSLWADLANEMHYYPDQALKSHFLSSINLLKKSGCFKFIRPIILGKTGRSGGRSFENCS